MAWNLTLHMIETCSCNMLCPCWFGVKDLMIMDQGWCASALLYQVRQGSSDRVDLSGCTLVLAYDFPGPTLLDGKGVARLYMEETATAAQRRELDEIFQGKKGGPMEILAGLVTKWLPTAVTRIEIREEGGILNAVVGDLGRLTSQPLKDEAGQAMTLQNAGFASMFRTENSTLQLAPSNSQWSDPEMPRRFETKSGASGTCHWSSV